MTLPEPSRQRAVCFKIISIYDIRGLLRAKEGALQSQKHPKAPFQKALSLIAFLALVLLVAWVGRSFTAASVETWYPTLQKPKWNPPDWVFAPVWAALYLMIAVSGWMVFTKEKHPWKSGVFWPYGAQLLLNVLWSYFFFFLKSPSLALADISLLLVMIFLNICVFWKMDRLAAALLVPYFFWTLYAATLNAAIWILNGNTPWN